MSTLRLATFNLENLDDAPDAEPPLAARLPVLREQLAHLAADILCLQEVNARREAQGRRRLAALDALLYGTPYASFARAWTRGRHGKGGLDVHNLVTLSRLPIRAERELRHELVPPPSYRPVTAAAPTVPEPVEWDRPALMVEIDAGSGRRLHVINLHLRAPLAAIVAGQKQPPLGWRSVSGWAEGFFLATLKRNGQALEVRLAVDRLLDAEPGALLAVCGDFNAGAREMPVRLILGDPQDTGNPALADRALEALEGRVAPERRFTILHDGRRVAFDHILASRALAACCVEVAIDNATLEDEAHAERAGRRCLGSFHAPAVASFDLPD